MDARLEALRYWFGVLMRGVEADTSGAGPPDSDEADEGSVASWPAERGTQ